jgi:hypothetical protein
VNPFWRRVSPVGDLFAAYVTHLPAGDGEKHHATRQAKS